MTNIKVAYLVNAVDKLVKLEKLTLSFLCMPLLAFRYDLNENFAAICKIPVWVEFKVFSLRKKVHFDNASKLATCEKVCTKISNKCEVLFHIFLCIKFWGEHFVHIVFNIIWQPKSPNWREIHFPRRHASCYFAHFVRGVSQCISDGFVGRTAREKAEKCRHSDIPSHWLLYIIAVFENFDSAA